MSTANKIQDFIRTSEVQNALNISLGAYTSDKAIREAYEANEARFRLVEKEEVVGLFIDGALVSIEGYTTDQWEDSREEWVEFFNA